MGTFEARDLLNEVIARMLEGRRQLLLDERLDVAVISKGDGFIWIDRKQYFRPELNDHFFQNYYGNRGSQGNGPGPDEEGGQEDGE